MEFLRTSVKFILLALLAGSCIYTHDGIYTAEPVPGEKAAVTASTSLDSLADPAVYDSLDLKVSYRFTVDNGEPYLVDCQLENLLVHEIGFYFNEDQVYFTYLDSLYTVESDTTLVTSGGDTVFFLAMDAAQRSYVLEGSFILRTLMSVTRGTHPLSMDFYYSANTNSLADLLRVEADLLELEYSILFDEGGQP